MLCEDRFVGELKYMKKERRMRERGPTADIQEVSLRVLE
jgi:hypothetical protein